MPNTIICGDALTVLRTLPGESVHCCITSPPYWNLRCYIEEGKPEKEYEIGLERTPEAHVAAMVEIFREVRRVLRGDGTLWLNYGDSYASSGSGAGQSNSNEANGKPCDNFRDAKYLNQRNPTTAVSGLKPKDLVGMPWRIAFALQADGWWLRQDIIWSKPNPMPESVTDRCTKSHEYVFLLSKSARYYFDAEAIKEESIRAGDIPGGKKAAILQPDMANNASKPVADTRNRRSVWTIATEPLKSVVSYGRHRTMSLDCPSHGCQVCRSRVPQCDALQAAWLFCYNPDTYDGLFREQVIFAAAKLLGRHASLWDGFSAILHSIQTHKKVGESRQGEIYDDKSFSRTEYMELLARLRAICDRKIDYNTWEDVLVDALEQGLWEQIPCHNDGRYKSDSFDLPPADCRCDYSGKVEKRQDHYAAFPQSLIIPCVKAGTSERGCCSKCGAPMVRVTEPSEEYAKQLGKSYTKHEDDLGKGMSDHPEGYKSVNASYITKGWSPSCTCEADTEPCVVLDCFLGAGTSALVAKNLGRNYIGIELNPDYIALANERIGGLF